MYSNIRMYAGRLVSNFVLINAQNLAPDKQAVFIMYVFMNLMKISYMYMFRKWYESWSYGHRRALIKDLPIGATTDR